MIHEMVYKKPIPLSFCFHHQHHHSQRMSSFVQASLSVEKNMFMLNFQYGNYPHTTSNTIKSKNGCLCCKFCAKALHVDVYGVEKAAETNSETEKRGRGLLLCESGDSNYARMLTIIWILNDLITSGLCCVL